MALGAETSLLAGGGRRDERGNRGIISPKTGVMLLVAAFGCAMMAEVVFNGGVLAGHRGELVSSIRHQKQQQQQRPFHQLVATGSVHKGKDTGSAIDAAIRGVPLVGETVADGLNKVTGGKIHKTPYMANAPKVKVDFYMEALCPGCQYFSTHVLAPVLGEPGIGELVDLNIVPAGNADLKWSDAEGKMKLTCQHGKEECEGNRILACLTHKHRNEQGFVKAVDCIEKGDSGFKVSETVSSAIDYISNVTAHKPSHTRMGRLAEACMKKAGIKSEPIFACSDGHHGEELAQQSVNATSSLVPKLEYAPWVVVNGVPLKEDAYSFKEHVCKAWKGVPPKECDKALLKDYFPRSQTLRGGTSKGAATKGQSKRGDAHEAGLKGHKQLLAAWQGGALFQKCLPDHF